MFKNPESNSTFLTKNKFAYDRLRESIIRGELKPGKRLIIRELSRRLGISAIPIREAIAKLTTEGLLIHTSHVGAIVSSIDFDELKEKYIIRAELEGLATLYATEFLNDRDYQMLQENIDRMRQVIKKKEFSKLGPLNKEFHKIIYQACPYKKIYKMIFDLWDDIERAQSIFALVPQRAGFTLQEHIGILHALQQKDGVLAQSLVKTQKQLAWKDLESFLNSDKSRTSNFYMQSRISHPDSKKVSGIPPKAKPLSQMIRSVDKRSRKSNLVQSADED